MNITAYQLILAPIYGNPFIALEDDSFVIQATKHFDSVESAEECALSFAVAWGCDINDFAGFMIAPVELGEHTDLADSFDRHSDAPYWSQASFDNLADLEGRTLADESPAADENDDEPWLDPENIYGLDSIRQSIEEDRRR